MAFKILKAYDLHIIWANNTSTTERYEAANYSDPARVARSQLREYMKLDSWNNLSIEKVYYKDGEEIPPKLLRRTSHAN